MVARKFVHAHHHLRAAFHCALIIVSRILYLTLHPPAFDSAQHAAEAFNAIEIGLHLALESQRKTFNCVRTGKGIHDPGHTALMRKNLLCAQRNTRRFFRRQCQRLIIAVGVQRLRAAQYRGHGLDCRTHNVVFRLLCRQCRAGSLCMKTQHPRLRILRLEFFPHHACPDLARRTELGNLFQKIVVRIEEERQPRCKTVDVKPLCHRCFDIGNAVRQRKCNLLRRCRSCLAHVIAGDGNRIPLRHLGPSPRKHVRDDAHCVPDWIDIRPARNVFLQHIILYRAREFGHVRTGTPRCRYVECQQNTCRRIDRH